MRLPSFVALLVTSLIVGCGGDGSSPSTPTPTVIPVATVVLDRSTAALIPGATLQLIATTRDAAGATLSGRAVTWQSSAGSVATVGADGLVTGVANGSATITATSEGKTATTSFAVVDGAVIGAAGGTVVANQGNATLTIPAGALASPTTITVTPLASPPAPGRIISNAAYELGPEGTTFAQPVTLTFKYPVAANAAADSIQLIYGISRFSNGTWNPLPGSSVDVATRTVTAQTSSFSQYGVGPRRYLGGVTITPTDVVVFVGQSRQFIGTARDLDGLPLPIPLQWLGGTGGSATITQTGVVTGVAPATGLVIAATATQWIQCNPKPCRGLWRGEPATFGDSVSTSFTGIANAIVALVPVKVIAISPAAPTIAAGQTQAMSATLKDSAGGTLSAQFRTVTWATSSSSVANVSAAGVVTAIAPGTATITAAAEGITGTATVTVTGSGTPVASVDVTPTNPNVEIGTTLALVVTPRDANNNPLTGRAATWTSESPAVATVSSTGVVSGLSVGTAIIIATVEGVQGGVQVNVIRPIPLVLGSPRAGSYFTCFLRSNSTTWCWGDGRQGQTGNGVTAAEQPTPSLVTNGAGFTQLETGFTHSCALNGGGQAFCWGTNTNGQLGNNSTSPSLTPVAVSGPNTFAQITAGQFHSCALTAAGAAWCWGTSGATGDANGTGSTRLTPVQVALAPAFTEIASTFSTTCALTSAGAVWCWGFGTSGETGNGGPLSSGDRMAMQIVGGITFTHIAGQSNHYCGVTAIGDAYCWGSNSLGQLGDGSTVSRSAPVKVVTTVKFTAIAAGGSHTCALAQDQTAWCWGLTGSLGDGTSSGGPLNRTTPVAVVGGRQFTEISAGGAHNCARATDGTWCWGGTNNGDLGDGVARNGLIQFVTPVKVVFPN
jgi:alpha-tubulin suppressor-like RCC1 family protein/uncharacterized protein YjdB